MQTPRLERRLRPEVPFSFFRPDGSDRVESFGRIELGVEQDAQLIDRPVVRSGR